MSFFELIDRVDKIVFLFIHHDSDQRFLDQIIPIFREASTWIPLYVLMVYYAIKIGERKAWIFILFSILTVACTDFVTASILKPFFARPRPCHDPELAGMVRNILNCGGLYSMPSNHAANHFGLAFFWYFAIEFINGKKWGWLWVWAAVIGYAQIYVGKHFPSDILVGAVFGCMAAFIMLIIFKRIWKMPNTNFPSMHWVAKNRSGKKIKTSY
jgi:membrane-associated phospholipid phosphatase